MYLVGMTNAAGWNDCESLLGLTQDILGDFELVCGACSPLPVFDICGFGSTFPASTSSCAVQHCAGTIVPWFDSNFEQCQNELRGFGGDDSDIAALIVFVETCRDVDASAPAPPACDPIFLGAGIGFQNVSPQSESAAQA